MSVFKKIPELDWLKRIAQDQNLYGEIGAEQDKLMDLYRYLLWSQRYRLGPTGTPMAQVCNGMLTKYYRRLFPMTLTKSATDYEKKFIAEAEKMRKQMLAETKKAKHGKV